MLGLGLAKLYAIISVVEAATVRLIASHRLGKDQSLNQLLDPPLSPVSGKYREWMREMMGGG